MADKDKANNDRIASLQRELDASRSKADKASRKARRRKKALKVAEAAAELAEQRAERSARKVSRWKRRAKGAENQVAVLQDLNRQLTIDYREDRAADAAALHFAAEAVAAFAADAVALREIVPNPDEDCSDYLDHLTFRLRQNLLEARTFLDEQGETGRAADLADLLNGLPPDNTHRH